MQYINIIFIHGNYLPLSCFIYCAYILGYTAKLNGVMWSYNFNISSIGACPQRGCPSPMCNKEKLILLRISATPCGQLLSLSRILSLHNIVKVLHNTSQQNQSISNCDISVTVLLLTRTFLPSCSGAIKISWCGNGKYFLIFIASIFQMTECIFCLITIYFKVLCSIPVPVHYSITDGW